MDHWSEVLTTKRVVVKVRRRFGSGVELIDGVVSYGGRVWNQAEAAILDVSVCMCVCAWWLWVEGKRKGKRMKIGDSDSGIMKRSLGA